MSEELKNSEEKENRTIDELLKLKTFQGMNDFEILSLINYSVERARQDKLYETIRDAENERTELIKNEYEKITQNADRHLNYLIEHKPFLEKVEKNEK